MATTTVQNLTWDPMENGKKIILRNHWIIWNQIGLEYSFDWSLQNICLCWWGNTRLLPMHAIVYHVGSFCWNKSKR